MKHLSWQEVNSYTDRLLFKIKADKKQFFTKVVGVERGGLNISKVLAEKLNLPHYSIKVSFYGDNNVRKTVPDVDYTNLDLNLLRIDNVLIVDDLVDSGATLKYLKENFNTNFKYATLFWNSKGEYKVKPDYHVMEKMNVWLVFPWETSE